MDIQDPKNVLVHIVNVCKMIVQTIIIVIIKDKSRSIFIKF